MLWSVIVMLSVFAVAAGSLNLPDWALHYLTGLSWYSMYSLSLIQWMIQSNTRNYNSGNILQIQFSTSSLLIIFAEIQSKTQVQCKGVQDHHNLKSPQKACHCINLDLAPEAMRGVCGHKQLFCMQVHIILVWVEFNTVALSLCVEHKKVLIAQCLCSWYYCSKLCNCSCYLIFYSVWVLVSEYQWFRIIPAKEYYDFNHLLWCIVLVQCMCVCVHSE